METDARSSRTLIASVRSERSIVVAAAITAAIAACVSMTGVANSLGVGEAGAAALPRAELRAIASRGDGALSTVLIEASEPVAYATSQPDALTVLIDLRNVRAGAVPQPVGPVAPVASVNVEQATAADGTPVARVRVRMDRPAAHHVRSARNVIYVEVDRQAEARLKPVAAASTAKAVASQAMAPVNAARAGAAAGAARKPATSIRSVRPLTLDSGVGIAIVGDGELLAARVEEARDLPARVLLDFPNVRAANVPAVTPINQGDVKRVRVGLNSQTPLITRVVVDLAQRIAYRVEQVGEELRVLFGEAAAQPPAQPADAAPAPAPAPAPENVPPVDAPSAPAAAPEKPVDTLPTSPAPVGLAAAVTTANAAAADASVSTRDPQPPAPIVEPAAPASLQPNQRFTGTPVSLDFQGADLRAVLRTFAEISGLNIVIDPSINGTVDVSLRDVPWDQALDIILKANKLGYSIDGSVVRIAPLNILAVEEEERRKLTEAQALAGELRVLTVPLSYAKAPDLVTILTQSALSARGEVQVDTRTNTLIIRDLPDRLATASDLIKALDRPQPQVEIEARIVQTTRDFARSIGVQWGFSGRVDPTLGNTTGLAFPNKGSLTGRTGGVQGSVQGDTVLERGVNLGVSAATSAVGLALGSVNGAVNLDVVLSQLERTGRGRLLSTPRVSTQNNVEAEMTQGVQIPIQTVANNTVTVSFKDAALTLRVTPQITAANTVIMRVFLENASPDFSRSVNNIPPIDTQRAVTTVLVADGETTVIGGIYVSREQATEGRVPALHRLPLLGWLFKRDEISDESRELLIFITPRISHG